MGDYHGIIPIPDKIKTGADIVVIPPSLASLFTSIEWPTVAAILASLYTALRIGELLYSWLKKRKK